MTDTATSEMFRMPALGADMTEGRVVEWLVTEGQSVARGDLVAVVETDKSDIEIEVFEPCVFEEFVVELNEVVPIGAPIARITNTGQHRSAPAAPAPPASAPAPASSAQKPAPEVSSKPDAAGSGSGDEAPSERHRMTPRARRLAAELGVDPAGLDHDGPITADTVLQAATPSEPADRAQRMRAAIAALMEQSWREIPHYHVSQELDITDLNRRLEDLNDERPVAERVVLAAALDVAIARAALDTPDMNGWWREGRFVAADRVDLGLIVSLRTGGIVAPTIVDAGSLDLDEMMQALADLVARSRRGRLRERDLEPASISITNMGERGTDAVAGIIYPPQVALVGLGAPRAVARIVDGSVVQRSVVEATVAGDHRAHDGLVAARFLRSVSQHLEAMP